ncbi:MAG: peptidase [Raoultibacter sp.]
MPAIMTHDFFGKDIYGELYTTIGGSRDESEAFLLGNQGPDPLFYSIISPRLKKFNRLGSTMHNEKPSELIFAMKQSLSVLDEDEAPIGRAYALGFLCHYTLDSAMHPLVFFNEYQACDAGVDDLSRTDGGEVHGVIESEFDEMVLFTKREETITTYAPSDNILHATDYVLSIISKMYAYLAVTVYGLFIPTNMFATAVKDFRVAQNVFYSPTGTKRNLIASLEERFRRYSFFRSMSHRVIELRESIFGNHANEPWENPFTGEISTDSFWDIYDRACATAKENIAAFLSPDFDLKAATKLTGDLDFSGEPTVARIVAEQLIEPDEANADEPFAVDAPPTSSAHHA